mgnify:CR=1 FL=1
MSVLSRIHRQYVIRSCGFGTNSILGHAEDCVKILIKTLYRKTKLGVIWFGSAFEIHAQCEIHAKFVFAGYRSFSTVHDKFSTTSD